jgi:hypothetical protein
MGWGHPDTTNRVGSPPVCESITSSFSGKNPWSLFASMLPPLLLEKLAQISVLGLQFFTDREDSPAEVE